MSGKNKKYEFSRRQFISAIGMGTAGLLLSRCKGSTGSTLGTADVAVASANSYERTALKNVVQKSFDALGGIGDIVKSGDTVGIKINLTGGSGYYTSKNAPLPPYELYLTHPEMVRAVGELCLDAGAKKIYILEAVNKDPADWNYTDPNSGLSYTSIAADLSAEIINLNNTDPYGSYVVLPVKDHYIYPTLTFNGILNEVDCFISIPKAKNHYNAAVTHGMKNSVGTLPVPCELYNNGTGYRAAIHDHTAIDDEPDNNLARVILDINTARPIHLVVNDAIKTTLSGEGPWQDYLTPINYNKIIVSKDAVAADTIATYQINRMNANADTLPKPPGGATINYLKLAEEKGMGINYLPNINLKIV